jgi:hypothetical protein
MSADDLQISSKQAFEDIGALKHQVESLKQDVDSLKTASKSGIVESEKEGKLYLNTTPCKAAQEAESVIFHKPYTKKDAGEIVCFGHHFDKVTVRQQ